MERTGSPTRSTSEFFASMSPADQVRHWEQRKQKADEIVSHAFETISQSGDVFPQEELYPLLPLLAVNIWTCIYGFQPERIVESSVMTEALFERLPSLAALSSERELAGVSR